MIYFANPVSPATIDAMAAGLIAMIDTPYQSKPTAVAAAHARGVLWCADNGAYTDRWTADRWWTWLTAPAQTDHLDRCLFATAPDVVGDHAATVARSAPWVPRIRAAGYRVAFVAQNGLEDDATFDWSLVDVLFLGGDDAFKLGPAGRVVTARALAAGKTVHMGRVNSQRRHAYARAIGCASVDGTFLTFGPARRLPDLLSWQRSLGQTALF